MGREAINVRTSEGVERVGRIVWARLFPRRRILVGPILRVAGKFRTQCVRDLRGKMRVRARARIERHGREDMRQVCFSEDRSE